MDERTDAKNEAAATGETKPRPSRDNCHWEDWEVGMLLARTLSGEDPEVTATGMHRKATGLDNKLRRLLAGKDACPEAYKHQLERLAARIEQQRALDGARQGRVDEHSQAEPLTGSVKGQAATHGGRKDMGSVTEQYKNLARLARENAEAIRHIEDLLVFSLATRITGLNVSDLTRFWDAETAAKISLLARRIAESRAGRPLTDAVKGVPDCPEIPPPPLRRVAAGAEPEATKPAELTELSEEFALEWKADKLDPRVFLAASRVVVVDGREPIYRIYERDDVGFSLLASDGELLVDCMHDLPASYETLEAAQAACQQIEDDIRRKGTRRQEAEPAASA